MATMIAELICLIPYKGAPNADSACKPDIEGLTKNSPRISRYGWGP
jgi:hypothetical protein